MTQTATAQTETTRPQNGHKTVPDLRIVEPPDDTNTDDANTDGIGVGEAVNQDANFVNRTMFTGDNLHVLRGLNSDSVDLIYLDPPFNSKKTWSAPIGSKAAGAAFKDTWTLSDIDVQWHEQLRAVNPALHDVILAAGAAGGDSTKSYLLMMAPRLMEMRRVLKDTGSIYLHCDPTESHALKLVMDCIFGRDNFRNEIIWHYKKWTNAARCFQRNNDVVLFYSASERYTFNKLYGPVTKRQKQLLSTGYNLGSSSGRQIARVYDREKAAGRIPEWKAEGRDIYYVDELPGSAISTVWDLPALNGRARERVGYPTQKPLALLERIIAASSNEGDVVLDPFAGCATAAIAAEKLGRQWVGIDISEKAVELVRHRLHDQIGLASLLAVDRADQPERTDLGDLPDCKNWKNELYGAQDGDCNGCGETFRKNNLTVDHIVPRAHGGTDHKDNLQLLCGYCNSRKGTGSMAKFMAKLLEERSR